MLWKQADFSNLQFRSRIWKLDRFIACNLWKQVTLCVHNDFDRFMFQKTKNIFPKVFYSVLVVKMCWQNIKKFVWALMVDNL